MSNFNFVMYSSIENYNDTNKIVEQFRREEMFDKCDWVICEKIHGANFSFVTNGCSIECARRSGVIKPDEDFFGYKRVFEKYKFSIMELWKEMKDKQMIRGLEEQIIVYGELFGGYYPEVEPIKDVKPIQKGVYYCPDIEWKAFDIYDGKDFVEWDAMKDLFNKFYIPFIGELSRGSFLKCKNYNNVFSTLIPQQFNLPPLQQSDFKNYAEGIVIRPLKNLVTTDSNRVILKIKIKDFDEIVKQAKPDAFSGFVNKNRLESVISKEGKLKQENKKRFITLLFEDAMKDVEKYNYGGKTFELMSKKNKAKVRRTLLEESETIVQKYLQNK